jgi:putative hydrolase of the HAD superfamily
VRWPEVQKPVRAVGFDLGETLITYAETPPSWASLYPAALGRVGAAIGVTLTVNQLSAGAELLAQFNTRLHPRREEVAAEIIFTLLLVHWGLPPAQHLAAAIEAFFGFFQQRLTTYPETSEVLAALRTRGFRLGILTDVPYGMPREFVQRDLAAAKIQGAVDRLLTSVEVGWRKPEAAGFRALARELQVDARELWFVGNEEKDILGALGVGAKVVLIDRDGRSPDWGQHHRLRNLRELLALV